MRLHRFILNNSEYIGLKSGCSRAYKAATAPRRVNSENRPANTVRGHCADRLKHRISGMESAFRYFFLDKVGFWAHNMHLKSLRQLRANKRFSPPEEKAAKGKEPQNGNGKRKL